MEFEMITEEKINVLDFKLIGISLPSKTTNENGQSGIDCGNLWQKFITENVVAKIQNKLSDEIYAVYYQYDGDHTKPFSYFIGCKVAEDTLTPDGMDSVIIKNGNYQKVIAKGKMPDCIGEAWIDIWNSKLDRQYITDFEVYGEKSQDWNNAEVEIYIGVK
jgi:predicted transcriptional regulator YdeE